MPYTKKKNDMHIVYKIYINDIRGTIQKYINILHNIYFIAKHFMGCFRDNAKERKFCLGFFGGRTSVTVLCLYLWQHNGNRTEFKQSSEDESQTYSSSLYILYYNIWLFCDKNICAAHTTISKWGLLVVVVFSVGRKNSSSAFVHATIDVVTVTVVVVVEI